MFPETVPPVLVDQAFRIFIQVRLRGAGGARTRDWRIMRSMASCTMGASCTDSTDSIALTALAPLALSGASVHEPVHMARQAEIREHNPA
jgi:hypothetical protein